MALDILPGEIIVNDRQTWHDLIIRSISLRDPGALVGPGTQPDIDAWALADQLTIQSENARRIGHGIPLAELTKDQLDQRLSDLGVPSRFLAVGASGYVKVSAASTGTTIFAGEVLTDPLTNLQFQCVATAAYADGAAAPVFAIDTGPSTNLAGGTVLNWSAPRPGCFSRAIVATQPDGSGLSDGANAEGDDQVRQRISDTLANPPASGNDAAYQALIQDSKGHGVAVERGFTYPAVSGPGTTSFVFTLKPSHPGGSRIPNSAQITAVRTWVEGQVPADDQSMAATLLGQSVDIVLDVQWAQGALDWTDSSPWPLRYSVGGTPGAITVSAAASSTVFTLSSTNYSGIAQPAIGQTIAFYDNANGVFSRKKILSFTGTGPWVVTCDTANAASDTTYSPIVGQRAMPWSDSLITLVPAVVAYFGTLGPGEQIASFFDPGLRGRRNPRAPKYWPNVISNHLASDILNLDSVQDAIVREGLGTTTTVGTVGAVSYLMQLGQISAFPL